MKKTCFLFSVLFLGATVMAQDAFRDSLRNVSVNEDSRISLLVQKSREINENIYRRTLQSLQGFRVQVVNTNDRKNAIDVKTRLLSVFPDESTYLTYHSPYFKVQIGNFRTREDAEELLNAVKQIYPTGVFIVPAKVELTPSREGDVIVEVLNQRP